MRRIDVAEVSWDLAEDLETFQLESFVLAALSFDAIGLGMSLLEFTNMANTLSLVRIDRHHICESFQELDIGAGRDCYLIRDSEKINCPKFYAQI